MNEISETGALSGVVDGLLPDDVAVITGGGSGIGRASAIAMALAGASVAVADTNLAGAEEVAKAIREQGGTAIAIEVDVVDIASCEAVADRVKAELGASSILVNSAGIQRRSKLEEEGYLDAFRATISVNLDGTINMIRALQSQLTETGGRIVNVGSIASFVAPLSDNSPYYISKGAILQLTKAFSTELAPQGVRVNGVAPGPTKTALTQNMRAATSVMPVSRAPLQRWAEAGEIAGPIVFLASRMSSYITGQMLPVDGGFLSV